MPDSPCGIWPPNPKHCPECWFSAFDYAPSSVMREAAEAAAREAAETDEGDE